MRTGSVGNRSAEDMIRTLVESKKAIITPVRSKLLSLGYSEEVEYDAINIEPVLAYNRLDKTVFLKHKWELVAVIPIQPTDADSVFSTHQGLDLRSLEFTDEEGKRWLKFQLPSKQKELFLYLANWTQGK